MGWSQIFLKISFERAGALEGESETAGFENQIVLMDFDWSMEAGKDIVKGTGAGRQNTRRLNMDTLQLTKRFDASSTSLMSCLASRDRIKSARVSVAQGFAGEAAAREAFALEVENAYIESIDLNMTADGKAMVLQENISIRFSKIKVEVVPVSAAGKYTSSKTFFRAEVNDSMALKT